MEFDFTRRPEEPERAHQVGGRNLYMRAPSGRRLPVGIEYATGGEIAPLAASLVTTPLNAEAVSEAFIPLGVAADHVAEAMRGFGVSVGYQARVLGEFVTQGLPDPDER